MKTAIDEGARVALALAALAATAGCSDAPDQPTVWASAETIDRTTQALSSGALQWADGTYSAGCLTKASGNWSLRLGGSNTMDYGALTVVQGNTACTLTLTKIVADHTYTPTTAITLGSSFPGSAQPFSYMGTIGFYANADLSAVSFAGAFTVNLPFSDDPKLASGSLMGTYAVESGSATASSENAPNYTLDLNSGALTVNTDVNDNVLSVTGYAVLTNGTYTGNGYYVDQGTLPASPSFAQLDNGYTNGSPTTISGANPQVAASAFGLTGVSLSSSVVRTIVIQRASNGVKSYQMLAITFSHP